MTGDTQFRSVCSPDANVCWASWDCCAEAVRRQHLLAEIRAFGVSAVRSYATAEHRALTLELRSTAWRGPPSLVSSGDVALVSPLS